MFKPQDEEPGAAYNPRGRTPSGSADGAGSLRRGVRPGEGAMREVAAFLLDRAHFAGVPPTALVSCQPQPLAGGAPAADPDVDPPVGMKVGSLQQFVHAESDCEDRGPAPFPGGEVHKIAQLDLRLANTDRNGGNILARRRSNGVWQLIPVSPRSKIGHTLMFLPSSLRGAPDSAYTARCCGAAGAGLPLLAVPGQSSVRESLSTLHSFFVQ